GRALRRELPTSLFPAWPRATGSSRSATIGTGPSPGRRSVVRCWSTNGSTRRPATPTGSSRRRHLPLRMHWWTFTTVLPRTTSGTRGGWRSWRHAPDAGTWFGARGGRLLPAERAGGAPEIVAAPVRALP